MTRLLTAASLLLVITDCAGAGDGTLDGTPQDDAQVVDVAPDLGSDALPDSLSDVVFDTADPRTDARSVEIQETSPDTIEVAPDTGEDTLFDTIPETAPAPEVPLPGFGEITGACGVLGPAELTGESPAVFVNHLDVGDDPYGDEDLELLTAGGQEIWSDGNAGGSSIYSEIFAYEILYRCELAVLLKTEMEVEYQIPDSQITDLLVEIDGSRIGVSVTRAVGWPRDAAWTTDQAVVLLEKKLKGIQDSSAAVAPSDAWTKQILHVIAYADQHAEAIQAALAESIAPELLGDTIVIVTVSDGDDGFLY
ncbi:MAG: hypothetical protein ABIK09_07740 [Pseudomonadota bacterium]